MGVLSKNPTPSLFMVSDPSAVKMSGNVRECPGMSGNVRGDKNPAGIYTRMPSHNHG